MAAVLFPPQTTTLIPRKKPDAVQMLTIPAPQAFRLQLETPAANVGDGLPRPRTAGSVARHSPDVSNPAA
ncbi:hypothetical protein chiPu_0016742 [Chiloscyllium punctatum]|uniref:Uncharacterized protein n=1 Tax=Chiloscyllium punctatum TaxID=137246 RepID=A0A401T6H7_CHIPU|nr:hypothetical protein [Chiloscyllium punctatum]